MAWHSKKYYKIKKKMTLAKNEAEWQRLFKELEKEIEVDYIT